jgi:hypothetical protein
MVSDIGAVTRKSKAFCHFFYAIDGKTAQEKSTSVQKTEPL